MYTKQVYFFFQFLFADLRAIQDITRELNEKYKPYGNGSNAAAALYHRVFLSCAIIMLIV